MGNLEIRTRSYPHQDLIGRIPTIVKRRRGGKLEFFKFDRFEVVPCRGARSCSQGDADEARPYSTHESQQSPPTVRYAPIYIKI